MPTWWWAVWLGWDVAFGAWDLIAVTKPLGWFFAALMLAFAIWNGIHLARNLRPRMLSPKTDPKFWTRRA